MSLSISILSFYKLYIQLPNSFSNLKYLVILLFYITIYLIATFFPLNLKSNHYLPFKHLNQFQTLFLRILTKDRIDSRKKSVN